MNTFAALLITSFVAFIVRGVYYGLTVSVCVFLWQHHSQAQGSGGAEPGLRGVPGPAVGSVSGALRRGVALGAGRGGPEAGGRSRT